jgi:tetratricopeptide (TPR) repeat protein
MKFAEKYKKDLFWLVEGGFIAINMADEDSAKKLFKAAELIDPNLTLPKIGYGYLHLHKLELKQAVEMFDKVLEKEPNNEMAKAFKGVCYSLMPNKANDGEKLLEQTEKSDNPLISKLSHTSIDFINKFVKKPSGPAGR